MNSPCLYLEIGQNSLEALQGEHRWESPLERDENGRLTGASRQQVISGLQGFLKNHGGRPRQRALCALSARGVSLRRLTLPPASKEERQRLLLMQIESEFPLPPEQLAWGFSHVENGSSARNGGAAREDFVVAAVKKEVVEEYGEILAQCGLNPEFTLAALSRGYACQRPPPSFAVLEVGTAHSEFISFENGNPVSIRMLAWGGANVSKSLQEALGISFAEAQRLKSDLDQGAAAGGESSSKVQNAVGQAMDALAGAIGKNGKGQTLYVTGKGGQPRLLAPALSGRLGGIPCFALESARNPAVSAAISGLRAAEEQGLRPPPLLLELREAKRNGEATASPAPWKWGAIAVILTLVLLLLPSLEGFFQQPGLEKRLTSLKADRERLPAIDRELHFLQDLKQNQPPYLDALAVFAGAISPGARIENLSMNRKGEISLRGKLPNAQQVVDFRSKLLDSGFFANVTVEEQSPSPDRMVNVRISARWKPAAQRAALAIETPANEPGKNPGGPNASSPFPGPAVKPSPSKPSPAPPTATPGLPGNLKP